MIPSRLLAVVLIAAAPVFAAAARTDRQIEETARASYTMRKVLNGAVDIKVQNGVAVLTGTVREPNQARLAEDTIARMEGVRRVENRIKVDRNASDASDAWLAVKVRSHLLVKSHASLARTDVHVKDGVVTLAGIAATEEQKELMEAYAKEVAGVRRVENRIEVVEDPDAPREAARDAAGREIDDVSISAEINFALLTHRSTSALATSVRTKDGRVTILGEADSQAEKQMVTQLAEKVRGVVSVDNQMTVREN